LINAPKIDLSANIRNSAIGLLQPRLSDAIDLASQAKQAHWTVRGANFIALHELFDRIASEIGAFSDVIAERISSLGGQAEGTARIAAERSSLPKYPLNITDSGALAIFGGSVRQAIDRASDIGDQTTSDVFTEVSRGVDKLLWFVEAHAAAGNR
jgi:starvation-inducible DNA-binding protein